MMKNKPEDFGGWLLYCAATLSGGLLVVIVSVVLIGLPVVAYLYLPLVGFFIFLLPWAPVALACFGLLHDLFQDDRSR